MFQHYFTLESDLAVLLSFFILFFLKETVNNCHKNSALVRSCFCSSTIYESFWLICFNGVSFYIIFALRYKLTSFHVIFVFLLYRFFGMEK